MKKYELTLVREDGFPITNKDGYPLHRLKIEAESPEQACESFIKSHKPLPFGKINITWNYGWSFKNFDPPHYEGHKSNEDFEKEKTPSYESSKGGVSEDAISSSTDQKLDKIYDVLNHIRWIGLGIGGMFALTFIVPQCTGG